MHMNDRKKNKKLETYEKKLDEGLFSDKFLLKSITMGVYRKDNEKLLVKPKTILFLKKIV